MNKLLFFDILVIRVGKIKFLVNVYFLGIDLIGVMFLEVDFY